MKCGLNSQRMDLYELTSRNDIGKVLDAAKASVGVEVGVAFGENAEVILKGSAILRLYLVDPWNYVPNEDPTGFADAIKDWAGCYEYAKAKMDAFGGRAVMIRTDSVSAAAGFTDGSRDFVYIDANHMRPMIDKDLAAWWPKVRKGGILGGHDYHMVDRPDYKCEVKAAVDKFFADKGYAIHVTTEDQDPSWYVIK